MADLEIADAETRDIRAISLIMPAAFGPLGGHGTDTWEDYAFIAQGIKLCALNLPSRQRITVARLDGHTLACAHTALALAPDRRRALRQIGLVHGIATDTGARRQGHARALLAACETQLADEGARVVAAEVRPRAVAFFAAQGYHITGARLLVLRSDAGNYRLARSLLASTTLMWKALPGHSYRARPRRDGLIIEKGTP